jgi:hypothetical protein
MKVLSDGEIMKECLEAAENGQKNRYEWHNVISCIHLWYWHGVKYDQEISCLKGNKIDQYSADLCDTIKKVLWKQKVAVPVTDRLDCQVCPEVIEALLHVSPAT